MNAYRPPCRPVDAAGRRHALHAGVAMLLAAALPAFAQHAGAASAAATPMKSRVLFQITDNDPQRWTMALNNLQNLRDGVAPEPVELELVAFGPGILMLRNDSPVKARIEAAVEAGVRFSVCQNTMTGMKLAPSDMLVQASFVPSGVVEVMRRQQQGWVYIRN